MSIVDVVGLDPDQSSVLELAGLVIPDSNLTYSDFFAHVVLKTLVNKN